MKLPRRNRALILTRNIVPGHQIARLLEMHGWVASSCHESLELEQIRDINPGLLVIDVSDPAEGNMRLLQSCCFSPSIRYRVALCRGGNTPAMRAARRLGVDGFFYLNAAGKSVDTSIGLAALLLQSRCGFPGVPAEAAPHITQRLSPQYA